MVKEYFMKFKPVSKLNVSLMEECTLKRWKDENISKKSLSSRQNGQEFVFYEGPPTANGKPGVHHVLARVFKDMFPRYKIMRGYHVSRRGGWDTHGLPVEIEVEKKHGFKNKQQIEEYGVEKFNAECRASAFEYMQEWEKLTERIAYDVDLKSAYVTFTNEYIETVWWILSQLWSKELLYQGFKVVPYCPRCGTPLSDHEVDLGYEDKTDMSVYVRFSVSNQPNTYFLVWTTTPWTLPSNVSIAVEKNTDYVKVEHFDSNGNFEFLILAKNLVEKVFGTETVKVVEEFKGHQLEKVSYKPLFDFFSMEKQAHYVSLADFVTTDSGTGLVHIAPAYGADDMQVAKEYNLPVLMSVLPNGTFMDEVTEWKGMSIHDANNPIIENLHQRGLLFRKELYTHSYPFCWRCKTPLIYYARKAWYIKTSVYKDELVELNQTVNWVPDHIKNGRFGNWLSNNVDWALSRERYWGTPLPVWECSDCGHQHCVGSIEELSKLTGKDMSTTDLHRPYVDDIHFNCQKCNGKMNRVIELVDVWFDSGAMPYAQWHYPFENQDKFLSQFPADYICEAVDQTRGWFYSLHAISTMLMNSVAYKNVVCLGLVLDADGRKMSKSLGNIVNPWDVLDVHGADALRWYLYTATPPGSERRFSVDLVGKVVRNFTLPLWNVYSFFVTYANIDKWNPTTEMTNGDIDTDKSSNYLDRWLLSELKILVRDVTDAYERYDVTNGTRPIESFVEQLSSWYLRRSRRRFWKSEDDADKNSAYETLYMTLITLSKLLAPSMPFLADELYQNLVRPFNESCESVHLSSWPVVQAVSAKNEQLSNDMELVMKLASLGHAARAKAEIKVRQPVSCIAFSVSNDHERKVVSRFTDTLMDELNTKTIRLLDSNTDALTHTVKPFQKQLGQKYKNKYPQLQNAILALDSEFIVDSLKNDDKVIVMVGDEKYEIFQDELEVKSLAKTGFAVAEDGACVAAVITDLTPELLSEGLAREFVRLVQDFRKEKMFEMQEFITLYVNSKTSPHTKEILLQQESYIKSEVLADGIVFGDTDDLLLSTMGELDKETIYFGMIKR